MSLEDYEIVEERVQDIRFGIINIYNSIEDKEYLIMEKSRRSYSHEDHAFSCMQAQERLKISHPNILKMLWVDEDNENWITSAYFEYPNEDLCDRREELSNPREMIRLMNDVLEAMAYLQRHKMVHGDIRPEYIFYNRAEGKYVLLDRLIDASPANEAQMNNIFYADKTLYASPVLFNELCQGNLKIKHNPFKSEVFSLGMVLVSLFVEETELMRCYNRRLKEFDYREFTKLTENLRTTTFVGDLEDLFGEYLFLCILNLNEKERLSPKKALKILRKGICEALSKMDEGQGLSAVEAENDQILSDREDADKKNKILETKPDADKEPPSNPEISPETQEMWDQYLQAKENIQMENPTERDSTNTGQSTSQRSHGENYVNHQRLNMPNLGGDIVQDANDSQNQDGELGHLDSETAQEDVVDVVGLMPTNFTSELVVVEDGVEFNRSQSAVEFQNLGIGQEGEDQNVRLGDLSSKQRNQGEYFFVVKRKIFGFMNHK